MDPWGSASSRGLTACWIMVPARKAGVSPALCWRLLARPDSRGAPKDLGAGKTPVQPRQRVGLTRWVAPCSARSQRPRLPAKPRSAPAPFASPRVARRVRRSPEDFRLGYVALRLQLPPRRCGRRSRPKEFARAPPRMTIQDVPFERAVCARMPTHVENLIFHRPQSSSSSRRTAGAFGFLNLSQSADAVLPLAASIAVIDNPGHLP
jgi:hypothetical protein